MDIAIIGGGITGLSAAYRLERLIPSARITLFEESGRLGGKIFTERSGPYLLEGAADSFLARKPRGVGLCEELGLAAQLHGRRPENKRTFVRRHGRLHPLPEGLSGFIPTDLSVLENHPLLSEEGLRRLKQEKTLPPFLGVEDESLATFVTRRLGREAYDNLVEPLMSGIFAGNGEQLSLLATYPQLRQVEQRAGSLLTGLAASSKNQGNDKYPPFVSFADGMGTLIKALAESLTNTELWLQTKVRRLHPAAGQWHVINDRQPYEADAVLLTTPTYVSSWLVDPFAPNLSNLLSQIDYASSAIVYLAIPKSDIEHLPESYGFVVPTIEQSDALACTWSSQNWAGRAPDDKLLLRVYLGRHGRQDVLQFDDETLVENALEEIRPIVGKSSVPEFCRVYRWPKAMPQYTMGHLERLAAIRQQLGNHPGLFMAGAAFDGVGIPNCIGSGEAAAEQISDYRLQTSDHRPQTGDQRQPITNNLVT